MWEEPLGGSPSQCWIKETNFSELPGLIHMSRWTLLLNESPPHTSPESISYAPFNQMPAGRVLTAAYCSELPIFLDSMWERPSATTQGSSQSTKTQSCSTPHFYIMLTHAWMQSFLPSIINPANISSGTNITFPSPSPVQKAEESIAEERHRQMALHIYVIQGLIFIPQFCD